MRSTAIYCFTVAALCVGLLPSASPAAAAEPPTSQRAPSTVYDYRDQLLAYNRQTLAGAYQQVGKKGPWDAGAVKFLDRMATYFTAGPLNWVYQPPDAVKSHDELIAAGKALLDAGCPDPLVTYCYGVALHDSGKPTEALPFVRTAVDGLDKAGYPSARVAAAASRLARIDRTPDNTARMHEIARAHRLKMCSGKFDDITRRVTVDHVWNDMTDWPREQQRTFVEELRKLPDVDPWVLNVLDGALHVKLAWDARGSGWANTVTEEGWQKFFDHLGKARDSLRSAYKLAPHLPEPCVQMITVSMGAGDQLGEAKETWFERAVAAQADNADAYGYMYNALLPRWGGDHGDIYDLGLRAAQSGRYDTVLPWQFVRAVQMITKDEGWDGVLARPGVYEAIAEVLSGYEGHAQKIGQKQPWYPSYHAALAWRAGKYADARRVLDRVGDEVVPNVFREFGSQNPRAAIGHVYAMSGPHAAAAKEAEAALAEGRLDDALKSFKALAAAPDQHPRAKPYLDARLSLVDRRAKFARGEWVDIQPNKEFTGWTVSIGNWTLDEESNEVQGDAGGETQHGATIVCNEAVGTRYEFSGVMMPWGPQGGGPGLLVGQGTRPALYVTIRPSEVWVLSGHGLRKCFPTTALADLNGAPATFVMTYDNGRVSLEVNGKLALDKFQAPADLQISDPHPGLYSSRVGLSRFRDLKVRRIPDVE